MARRTNFVELPEQPCIPVVAGPAVLYKAVLPTQRRTMQAFDFGFKGEDKWGNPSHQVSGRFTLEASIPVQGLPAFIDVTPGKAERSTTPRNTKMIPMSPTRPQFISPISRAELRAAMDGLRDARTEAEEMRAYIERMHANG